MDELQISGKRYISAKRIAKENGYTADYVGQLIRGGKVTGQKVGRAWYVDALSFDHYLGGEVTPAKQANTGYSDLPAGKSPEVLGPSPSQPPVSASLPEYELVPVAPVVVVEEKIIEAPVAPEPLSEAPQEVATPVVLKKIEPVKISGLHYYQEDEPTLPQIRSKKEAIVSDLRVMPTGTSEPIVKRHKRIARLAVLSILAVVVLAGSAFVASSVTLNLSIERGSAASAYYSLQW